MAVVVLYAWRSSHSLCVVVARMSDLTLDLIYLHRREY